MRKLLVTILLCALCLLPACSQSEETAVDDPLTLLLDSLSEESIFYAQSKPAYFFPVEILNETAGIYHYGNSTLIGTNLLFAYLPEQQELLLERLNRLDSAEFRVLEEPTVGGTTVLDAWIESADVTSWRLVICSDGEQIWLNLWDYQSDGKQSCYTGACVSGILDGLSGLYDACRTSTTLLSDTARIHVDGEPDKRVLPRWLNVELVNLVDGVTLGEPNGGNEQSWDAEIEIGEEFYYVNSETGKVLHNGKVWQLSDTQTSKVSLFLGQAKAPES